MICIIFGNYAKLTLPHQHESKFMPGQCAKINGKWFAIAELRNNEFDIIVPHDSHLLSTDNEDIVVDLPQGSGFSNIDTSEAVCLVAGTGLAAVLELVKYRSEKNLKTSVKMFGRHITGDCVVGVFPILRNMKFEAWNTIELGRPTIKSILPSDPGNPVFFAGPKGFLDEIRLVSDQKIILNF